MAEGEERFTESQRSVNTISELPSRPFAVTVEFSLFVIMMALSLSGVAVSNIILYRTCVHSLHYDELECQAFLKPEKSNDTHRLEDEVQKYANYVTTVKMVIESVVPAVVSMFLGVWSDTHGRKPLIVWPVLGIALSAMLTVVYSMMRNLGPWWFLLTAIPFSLTGGYTVLFMGAFCFLSDITSASQRSLRMTVLEASLSIGTITGGLLSIHLLKAVGNVFLLLIVSALLVIAYVQTNLYLKESITGAIDGGLCTVIDFLLVKEMLTECFKRRPNYGRAQILLLTLANCFIIFVIYGLFNLDYMYTREKLHWALKEYTIYSAVSTLIYSVGSLFGAAVIQRFCGVGDLAFIILAFVTTIAEFMIKAFATLNWHMYLASGIAVFKTLGSPLIRSFLTKIVPLEDIAKVFALMCAIEAIWPLLAPVIYTALYNLTISSFPGAIYILSSAISAVCLVLIGFVVYYRHRNSSVTYTNISVNT